MWSRLSILLIGLNAASAFLIPSRQGRFFSPLSQRGERGPTPPKLSTVPPPVLPVLETPKASPPSESGFPQEAPPFSLADLKRVIPARCLQKSAAKSLSFLAKDLAIIAALSVTANALDNPLFWPLYWFAQGTMFWALFVVGHDCGHGSFSDDRKLNDLIGHLTHSSILVPYHGWQISHRTHHQNHGHVDNDESWYPLAESKYNSLPAASQAARFELPFMLLAFPVYLFRRTPGRESCSHLDPQGSLFADRERNLIATSRNWYCGMIALLGALGLAFGPLWLLKMYIIPYIIGTAWLVIVTYLHHTDARVPWYRGEEWSYLRGALSTLDRDYGMFNSITHNIETHVIHHIFPQIPHYHLVEASEAIKPVLGKFYVEPEKSVGPFPFHLIRALKDSVRDCRMVDDHGDVVWYRGDAGGEERADGQSL
uniref:Fatty acid desaturase domain-containing protein n=1 Tax=Chromera velia CCMP2878 TaxID=1169474 RepID=A0A0G4GNS3_9ALVE|eukprot:Cvel_22707.t1-p1 / transcript=Cvel_22707.t1 / gene=Cvel_22707 / organism=Chromera_velia_CCMP2878 / gene_product=Omega-3 fatty acid desaturase, chloroplastic, putative / transcript_product=Omega-3 fatty acid desaturase, chloroplastic, putative / location=Cvel_scaffold2262:5889-9721(-) / protein_length=425 / sequence_SO=supercontig / SO=protein_coding / is_pseudo=false